jgi:hypothetical protein
MRGLDVQITVIVLLICASAILDTSITGIATSTGGLSASLFDIVFFTYMVVLFGYSQYVILRYVGKKNKEFQSKPFFYKIKLSLLGRSVTIIQYILIGILVLTLLQILLFQSYQIILLKAVIFISFFSSGIVLVLLAYRLTSWLWVNRNMVVLMYSLAIATLAVNSFLAFLYLNSEYSDNPDVIRPVRSLPGAFASPDVILQPIYVVISVFSFVLTWAATAFLLKNYSSKLGKLRYWILVTIPLAYFLSQFQPVFLYAFVEFRTSEPVLFGIIYSVVFSAAKPIGALLFGIGFWSVSKSVQNKAVKDYMMISAFGITLIFTANQPLGLIFAPYPPFGLVTICFMGLGSYLLAVGIYASALSVANDSILRRTIRNKVTQQTSLLDRIGTAQMMREIENFVLQSSRDISSKMQSESGVESSLSDEEIRDYISEVISEVKHREEKSKG